jgi:hypothetical protein
MLLNSFCCSPDVGAGDLGPSWSSAIGGGLGNRGLLRGDAVAIPVCEAGVIVFVLC